ncbi:hypothetical protein RND71_028845 [Anisodus tanguticus]|uniref:Uncharacterized protein n=1 Tax=Anisodus tanguticus TaxID=243964 RepID=A0AAE1RM71_9SOLA|nr:hypothetical protein RND71_028845 [Anisodus tanguticus]
MWPALVVAAAAGSGFFAKKIFNQNATQPTQSNIKCDKPNDPDGFTTSFHHKDSTFTSNCDKPNDPQGFTTPFQYTDSIFTMTQKGLTPVFSIKIQALLVIVINPMTQKGLPLIFSIQIQPLHVILGAAFKKIVRGLSDGSIFRFSSACGSEMGSRNLRKKNVEGSRKTKGNVMECKRNNNGGKLGGKCGNIRGGEKELFRLNGKRFYVCLKKRTNKVPSGKCDSCASKAEIDEKNDSNENRNIYRALDRQMAEEGECESSVVTEELQPEVMEMDQLEAELESELQKLPWCATEDTDLNGGRDPSKDDFMEKKLNQTDDRNAETYKFSGVLPSELDQKLCHLLIEQQESQILELESELCQTHSKLHEKEAELQALKDCVRRLTEFSLGNASDEEIYRKMEDDMSGGGDQEKKIGHESGKSILGMKRSMNF